MYLNEKMRMSLVRLTLILLTSQRFHQVGTQILQESESPASSALHCDGSYNFLEIIIWSTWDRNVWSWASESLVERGPSPHSEVCWEKAPPENHKVCDPSLMFVQTPVILWTWPENSLSEGIHMEDIFQNSSFLHLEQSVRQREAGYKERASQELSKCDRTPTTNIWPLFVKQKTSGEKPCQEQYWLSISELKLWKKLKMRDKK